MGWLCRECSNYNDDSFEKCIVCDADRPDITLLTLTAKKVSEMRLGGIVLIPADYSVVGENAFRDRLDVTCLILHENVKKISKNAFYGCSNLKEIRNYAKLETISTRAFYNCTSLSEKDRLLADYVAPDAYGSTVEDIMRTSFSDYEKEPVDYTLAPPTKEPEVKVTGSIKVKKNKRDKDLYTKKERIKKSKVKVKEKTMPKERSYTIKKELPKATKTVLDLTEKKVGRFKSGYEKIADVCTFLVLFCLPIALFSLISSFANWFDFALNLFYVLLGFIIPFTAFCACAVLGGYKSERIAHIVNGVIGALFAVLSLVITIFVPTALYLAFAVSLFGFSSLLIIALYLLYEIKHYRLNYKKNLMIFAFIISGVLFLEGIINTVLISI